MSDNWHVLPVNDLIDHQDNDNCLCGPTTEPVKRDNGSIGWIHTHHSLDGREHTENTGKITHKEAPKQ